MVVLIFLKKDKIPKAMQVGRKKKTQVVTPFPYVFVPGEGVPCEDRGLGWREATAVSVVVTK